jgi:hypothetical protein
MSTFTLSAVEDVGPYHGQCGYCDRSEDSSSSHGMWAHHLSVDVYQVSTSATCNVSLSHE